MALAVNLFFQKGSFSSLTFYIFWQKSSKAQFRRHQLAKNMYLKLKPSSFRRCNRLKKKNFNPLKKFVTAGYIAPPGDDPFSTLKVHKHPYFDTILLEHFRKTGVTTCRKILTRSDD